MGVPMRAPPNAERPAPVATGSGPQNQIGKDGAINPTNSFLESDNQVVRCRGTF
jgi:hypothetical protein